jgi:hypothetical protein
LWVRSDSTTADLHDTLELAMGWSDSRLNQFIIHGREYGFSCIGGVRFSNDPSHVRLADFLF